jgi:uncharacterized protein
MHWASKERCKLDVQGIISKREKESVIVRKFPVNIQNKIKRYVYLYIDPRSGEVFYVGKGFGNRAFSHLSDTSEKEKAKRIKEIKKEGYEPIIEILIHGINDDNTIKRIEASVIDLIGVDKLTNIQKGYEAREHGRMSINQIIAMYQSKKVKITEPSILININKSFHFGINPVELYDVTRTAWKVGNKRNKVHYAFSVYQGIVQEVYEIMGWYRNKSTFNSKENEISSNDKDRW